MRRNAGRRDEAATAAGENTAVATFWDIDDIQFHCRVGRTTAWKLVKRPDFPDPVVVGPHGLVWPRAEVVAFMDTRRSPSHYGRRHDLPAVPADSFVSRPVAVRGS